MYGCSREDAQEVEIREDEEDISEMAKELGIDLQGTGEDRTTISRPRHVEMRRMTTADDEDDPDPFEGFDVADAGRMRNATMAGSTTMTMTTIRLQTRLGRRVGGFDIGRRRRR